MAILPQTAQHEKPLSPLENALNLAAQGFKVFPLKTDKTPAIKKWPLAATTGAEQIKTWWRARPAANAGIVTTTYEEQHLCVLDLDLKNGKNGIDELMRLADVHGGDIPATRTVSTTTGGMHLYFRTSHLVKSGTDVLAPGIDIKADRGYVVAPGSVLNGKPYVLGDPAAPIAELPEWLLRLLPKAGEAKERTAEVVQFPVPADLPHNVKRAIDYLVNHAPLALQGSGGDQTTFTVACRVREEYGLSEETALDLMLEYWNDRCAPPWTPEDLDVKVGNAYRYATNPFANGTPEAQFEPIPDAPDATVLSPGAPMEAAREFMRARYTVDKLPALHHHGGEFYSWQGSHYVETSPDSVTAEMYRFMASAYQHDKEKQTLVRYHPTQPRVSNALHALKAVAHLSPSVQAPAWLAGHSAPAGELIACANGLLHVPSRRLIPHSPAYFNRNALAFDYDPAAAEPGEWLRFLDSVWPDDPEAIGTLQEIVGYLLTADTSQQKLFMLVGPKRSGKGTIGRVIAELVGRENAVGPTLGSLAGQFGLAPLIGKQVAVIADARLGGRADQHAIAERLLSISGEDTLTIDRKFRDPYTGRLFTRFLIMSNELPRLADASGALSSRFVLLAMQTSFYGREDSGLTARLLGELPGILNWSLVGLDRLRQRGYFVQPASSREAIEDLDALTSPIGAFIKECCELGPAFETTTDALYDGWRHWCGKQGREHPGSKASFGRDLMAAAPGLKKTRIRHGAGRAHAYQGIRLLVDEWGNPIGEK